MSLAAIVLAGFLATGSTMGQSVSVALEGAIFAGLGGATAGGILASNHAHGAQITTLQQTFAHSFQVTFLVCAAIACVGVFTSLVRGKEERKNK